MYTMSRMVACLALAVFAVTCVAQDATQGSKGLPIIPGAAGFGMETPAGSGRHLEVPETQVIKVTNLNTEGPGSLREALEAEGPRVIVFEVSGNMDFRPFGSLGIRNPYVTIAGQTAPSPGITLQACEFHINTHDVLMQHIRVRPGDLLDPNKPSKKRPPGWTQFGERDAMKLAGDRIVVDHCSFSWATDENVQSRGNDVTFRHNIFSEGLDSALHHKGGHSRGLLVMNQGGKDTRNEGQRIAVLGNLFVHNKGRNPSVLHGATAVVANNFIENANFALKGDATLRTNYQVISWQGNAVQRTRSPVVARAMHPESKYYVGTDNIFNGEELDSMEEAWSFVDMPFEPGVAQEHRASEPPITVPRLKIKPGSEVKDWVLANAGARPADRDPVDARVVKDAREKTGKIPASQEDVGSWPELAENYRELSIPENPNGDDDGDGYTNLEEWLHEFADKVEGR